MNTHVATGDLVGVEKLGEFVDKAGLLLGAKVMEDSVGDTVGT